MQTFKDWLDEAKKKKKDLKKDSNDPCWDGYVQLGTKKKDGKEVPNCVPIEEAALEEAEYNGKKVQLDKPFRTPDGPKKFAVYVKNELGNVVIVRFGDPDSSIKRDNDERRASFRARHGCDDDPGPKWKAKYWSCKFWEKDSPVSELLK